MQFVYEVILPNKVLRNHTLSENMQWNYASLNVTLNYLMHEIMEFCVTSSLALDNWGQDRCQILGNKPNHSHQVCCDSLFHSVYLVFPKSLFSIENLFAVRYLWDVCIEDKCCVVTQRAAVIRVVWIVYLACLRSHVLRAYCNFVLNKRTRLRPNKKFSFISLHLDKVL